MLSHDSTHQSDRPWTLPSQPRAPESAPSICCPPAAATVVRAVPRGWDPATVLVLLGVLLCGIRVVAAVQGLDLALGADARRVRVCNSFDYSPATSWCTISDPFIVAHHGTTNASLQIAVSGDAARARVPVTIEVSESNGAGLVVATGSTLRVLQPDRAGVAVIPLLGVFTACGIPLPAAPAGSTSWQRATYTVAVRNRTTSLGETMVHVAL